MRVQAYLDAANALPVVDPGAFLRGRGLVVVAPHPDDESLGCGGLIAAACADGLPVHVIVVSDGTGSHRNSKRYPSTVLRDLREGEARAAATHLGLRQDQISFLRLPDQHVPDESAVVDDAITAAVASCDAGTLCVSWLHDPHCDHVASARLALAAWRGLRNTRLFFYPIWAWTLPAETEIAGTPAGCRVEISRFREAKAAAVAAHRSQTTDLITDDPHGFRLRDDMLARFDTPFELFLQPGSSALESL